MRLVHEQSGPPILGYLAEITTTHIQYNSVSSSESGKSGQPFRTSTTHQRIDQLSTATLDPALFEIPVGFAQVDNVETGSAPPSLSYRLTIAWARLMQSFSH